MTLLEEASQVVEDIICAADLCTGRAKCKLMRDKFVYLDDKQVRWYLVKYTLHIYVLYDVNDKVSDVFWWSMAFFLSCCLCTWPISVESSPSRLKWAFALAPYYLTVLSRLVAKRSSNPQFGIFKEFLSTVTSLKLLQNYSRNTKILALRNFLCC